MIIGESRYGKAILDRAGATGTRCCTPARRAARPPDGLLAFDATVTSASDVDAADLEAIRAHGSAALRSAVDAAVPLVEPLMLQLS